MPEHIPVLLNETIDALKIDKDGIYVDATLGLGGHSEKILEKLSCGSGFLIGIDQDIDAIEKAKKRLKKYIDDKKLIIKKNNFENLDEVLREENIEKIDGILFDLGVSSLQLDDKDRGFTYRETARLDMRMDKESSLDCYTLVNTFSEDDIYKIIRDYGEEKFAKNIAKHIAIEREKKAIETTTELLDIIKASIPAKLRWTDIQGKNPGKRTFQAFRIYINRELSVIDTALDKVIDHIKPSGRICVITFHSLEDKLVKDKFKTYENPCTCPKGYPCVCGKAPKGKMVSKKAIVAGDLEIEKNRRSHSAKLRIFERS